MAKYRSIQTGFWSDSKVIDDFTPEDRYFYLYLLTNEKSNQLGCYELSIKQMCRDTGYNEETTKKLLNRFEKILKVINYDYETKEIFIKNWHKYNWLESYNTKICIQKEFSLVKSNVLANLISPLYAPYMPHGSNKKKKEKEKEKKEEKECVYNSKISNNSSNDTHPTLTDIISFCSDNNIENFDCEYFYDYYEANGWVDMNGNKIKNWKAKIKTWYKKDIKNEELKQNKNKKKVEIIDGIRYEDGRRIL